MKIHKLKDDNGILAQTKEKLPIELYEALLKTLSELEDNECYKKRNWPHCQLHKIDVGKKIKNPVYECYIDKVSGWRFQVPHADGGYISLCNITSGAEHDEVGKIVKRKKNKFK